ncbi:uncharacterized protein L969DRAFT_84503 [Mixia osmundae IAM 14324]|uniref:Autophagy-related protein 14 n=1 Tax=Mixia osmundae (strain CBS 9802 / IAM 14324 / JCM 22182 / KY 12970) TaxID=764103 RepID=G7DZ94_MIXOS|nr:uncharacterized protein L969DRAFT_84503 [Mixia osmundae IAM 14324]KEI42629.1 hypothetical protein L969DRAFT_84503 [Mixia osmundae IAM 14324]GAA95904.1 hypothetical protein E5Q_02562 [Mixia osmundae IAM 14324]
MSQPVASGSRLRLPADRAIDTLQAQSAEAWQASQRRLRHVAAVHIRNLVCPAAVATAKAAPPPSTRAQGDLLTPPRPRLAERQYSHDDLDIPRSRRKRSATLKSQPSPTAQRYTPQRSKSYYSSLNDPSFDFEQREPLGPTKPALTRSKSRGSVRSIETYHTSLSTRSIAEEAGPLELVVKESPPDDAGPYSAIEAAPTSLKNRSPNRTTHQMLAPEWPANRADLDTSAYLQTTMPSTQRNRSNSRASQKSLASAASSGISGPSPIPLALHHHRHTSSQNQKAQRALQRAIENRLVDSMIIITPVSEAHQVLYASDIQSESMNPSFAITNGVSAHAGARQQLLLQIWASKSKAMGKGKHKATEETLSLAHERQINLADLKPMGTDLMRIASMLEDNSILLEIDDEYWLVPRKPSRAVDFAPLAGIESATDDSDDAGNTSDPGPGKLRTQALRKRERWRDRRTLLDRSLRETRMKPSYDLAHLQMIAEMQLKIGSMQVQTQTLQSKCAESLQADTVDLSSREASRLALCVETLRTQAVEIEQHRAGMSAKLDNGRAALAARRERLRRANERLVALREEQKTTTAHTQDKRQRLEILQASIVNVRGSLASQLSFLFPLEPVARPVHDLQFSLLGLPLANSDFSMRSDEEEAVSSALGYCALLTSLLAKYLSVALHFPIRFIGSQSLVTDPIHEMKGTRAFPLFYRSVEKHRFDYAVFLLNKDIEQLSQSQSIAVLDLRNTLPNVHLLLLSLASVTQSDEKRQQITKAAMELLANDADTRPDKLQEPAVQFMAKVQASPKGRSSAQSLAQPVPPLAMH